MNTPFLPNERLCAFDFAGDAYGVSELKRFLDSAAGDVCFDVFWDDTYVTAVYHRDTNRIEERSRTSIDFLKRCRGLSPSAPPA